MNKTRLNFAVDALIAVAFLISALTGVVFLFAGSGGYQGGQNPAFQTSILGVSRWLWSDLHTWASLIMITGVLLHVVLHWTWIVCVVRRMVQDWNKRRTQQREACPVIAES